MTAFNLVAIIGTVKVNTNILSANVVRQFSMVNFNYSTFLQGENC
jgi:hypothetical protein